MSKSYAGDNNVAHQVKAIYAGVNGVAQKVQRAYVGVNGVAQLIYQSRVYLWSSANGDNTALTGGWTTGTFYHQTNSGNSYSMTRMTAATWSGNHILQGTYSSTDGTSEKAMFLMSGKAIDFAPYKKLCAYMSRRTYRDNNVRDAWFGVFNASSPYFGMTCKTSELGTKFLAAATHSNAVNSEHVGFQLTVDISNINGSYMLVYDNYHENMNAEINISFSEIWLE